MSTKKTSFYFFIDPQKDFVDKALPNTEAQRKLPNLVALATAARKDMIYNKIFFTADTHGPDYAKTLEGSAIPSHCIRHSVGWGIVDELMPFVTAANVIEKNTFGTFALQKEITNLQGRTSGNTDDIEAHFAGFDSDICVISNMLILRAAFPNMRIVFHADASAGSTPEAHAAAILIAKSNQIEVVGE